MKKCRKLLSGSQSRYPLLHVLVTDKYYVHMNRTYSALLFQDSHPSVNGVQSPLLTNTTTLTVYVRNENDQNPEFSQSQYTATIAADAPQVSTISTVSNRNLFCQNLQLFYRVLLGSGFCCRVSTSNIRSRPGLAHSDRSRVLVGVERGVSLLHG